jgi:hypothetical protein
MNQYFANVAPYFSEDDQKNMSPVFQNAGAQQAYMNQQLGDANRLAQYQSYGTSGGGAGALALASMLRKSDPNAPKGASIGDRISNYFGTQQSPEMKDEIKKLESNTLNPMSDYYTGSNGWGSYGE